MKSEKTAFKNGKNIIIDEKTGKRKVITVNLENSLADQSFKEDCDVNVIISRYKKTGQLPSSVKQGIYADIIVTGKQIGRAHV